jgi:hypothetical protein
MSPEQEREMILDSMQSIHRHTGLTDLALKYADVVNVAEVTAWLDRQA